MDPQPHELQQDPVEGDRDLIDRELERQDERMQQRTVKKELSGSEKKPGQPPDSRHRAAEKLKDNAEADTGIPASSSSHETGGTVTSMANLAIAATVFMVGMAAGVARNAQRYRYERYIPRR